MANNAPAPAQGPQALPAIPFRKATLRKRSLLASYAIAADFTGEYIKELDSKGYIAGVNLLFSGTETTATADPTASSDFPWNTVSRYEIRDSAGGMLIRLEGYSAYLAARYFWPWREGTVDASSDTSIYSVSISAVQANTLAWNVPLWIETNTRDNLGLVPNQNAAFKYSLDVLFNGETNFVTTPANSTWAITMQPSYEYYSVPGPMRGDGRPQVTTPPFAGVIRQQWDEHQTIPSSAENRYDILPGKVIRNLILVDRATNGTGARANGISRVRFFFGDDTLLFETTGQELRARARMLFGRDAPTGVYPILFTDDSAGYIGGDFRRDYVDTRALAQCYMLVTTTSGADLTIIHDELIVPAGASL